jgi:integrase
MGRRRKTNLSLPPRLYLKHGAYYYVDKAGKWLRLSDSKPIALAKWAELEGETPNTDETNAYRPGTVGALIQRYMIEVAPKKAARTYQDNRQEANNLLKVFAQVATAGVRPMHIARYLDVRGAKAPVRANREISLLSHIFSFGMRWGIVDTNPCTGVAKHTEKSRDRYVTDSEFEGVKKLASPLIAALMDFAYLTALRKGDILTLKLEQITDEGIWIKQSKTGAKQLYEWTPALREVVDRARRLNPVVRGFVLFCNRRGKPYTDAGIKAMWNRVQVKWAESGGLRFTFHDIRAKALTDAKRLGMDAQTLAGHASAAMTEQYIRDREFKRVKPLR